MKTLIGSLFVIYVIVASPNVIAQAAAQEAAARCTVISIESRASRVEIHCTTDGGNARFAVPTTNSGTAARFADIALSAFLNNKKILIAYKLHDPNGPNFGCIAPGCRPAQAIRISE